MLLPGILYFLVFKYAPMYGVVIAFQKYNLYKGIFQSEWVGFKYFIEFFQGPDMWRLIRNTLLINIYQLLFAFPAPIILALAFNELRKAMFKKVSQTISFLPHFISTVVIAGLVVNFLSPSSGIANKFLGFFDISPISFLLIPDYFRTIFISMGIWKSVGWGTIIYLAAIAGINPELYEAASIDGASKLKKVWYVTLPGIMPVIIILFILQLGDILSVGAESIILLYNPVTYETADVLSTYVYRRGLISGEFSFAAAVDLFNSVVGLILVFTANKISKKVTETSIW
ncbi:ABC transporter permease [Paenibacillus oceani]|uniref:Sugar ABC transporter permease n=1 Tax=Paenibacillus oceani TaxID=2772510 RepID=A0A927CET7_9BACL|nr:ABC transporter permease subunit [Paenibacillus oceani]MBD2865328.1 sugar ABC transporter permease [Paenibacillus oceani]